MKKLTKIAALLLALIIAEALLKTPAKKYFTYRLPAKNE